MLGNYTTMDRSKQIAGEKGELKNALNELDNLSVGSNDEREDERNHWEGEDEDNSDEGEVAESEKDEKTNLLNAKALERYGAAEEEYAKMQLKDYQQRLFVRTTLLEDMRKAYLRDVVVLKNLMKVRK